MCSSDLGKTIFTCTSGCKGTDSFSGLAKGDQYSLILTGDTTGTKGSTSNINGVLTVTSAVPEPGTIAMMLSGVALMGFWIWRRRSQSEFSTGSLA